MNLSKNKGKSSTLKNLLKLLKFLNNKRKRQLIFVLINEYFWDYGNIYLNSGYSIF